MLVETRLYFVLWPSLEEVTGMAPKETKQVRIITEEISREHHKKNLLIFYILWQLVAVYTPEREGKWKAWRVNRNELCLLSCTGDRELRSFFLRTQLRALRGRRFRKEILSCPFGFWLCHKSSARQTAFISESLFSHIHMKMVQQDEHWHLFQHQKSWLGIICPQKVIFATTIHQD